MLIEQNLQRKSRSSYLIYDVTYSIKTLHLLSLRLIDSNLYSPFIAILLLFYLNSLSYFSLYLLPFDLLLPTFPFTLQLSLLLAFSTYLSYVLSLLPSNNTWNLLCNIQFRGIYLCIPYPYIFSLSLFSPYSLFYIPLLFFLLSLVPCSYC